MIKVLMVEDDPDITELLEEYLGRYGIEVFSVSSPSVGLEKLQLERYDLMLIDLGLPEMDGLDLCRIVKERYPELPIIVSTARIDVSDKVAAFEIGADDYVAKPYEPRELVARIQVLVKQYSRIVSPTGSSTFSVDRVKMQVFHEGQALDLTQAEYEIFALLLEKKGEVVSREYIANSTDSLRWDSSDRSIDVIVGRIRQKIGDDSRHPHYIKSVRGVGYKYIGS
ncbi:response regulator transcription factor [Sulfurovum sp. NBC37-1]|uniref:response regulator transcription factor n=1 Tax=Sulfurovum sp. (strain NBC37-1) TaxID=387093 RepID=UPI00031314D5|nr:response regulator transcription factor [Sulfurovum sp. NBC37-1]